MKRRDFITLLGGAAAWPLVARTQQPAMPVIGLVSSRSPGESAPHEMAFRLGLKDSGYVESENVHIAFPLGRRTTCLVDQPHRARSRAR